MKSNKSKLLWAELAHQAQHSPGGDETIAACYQAIVNLGKSNRVWRRVLEKAYGNREMPDKYKVNLLFRGIQYMWLFEEEDERYPREFGDVRLWERELPHITNKHRGVFEKILSEWDTGTTVYQRYTGPKAILSALWPRKKLTVLDLGCGGNHGLPGLMGGEVFLPVVDHSLGEVVSKWLNRGIKFRLGISVDKHDPYDKLMANWRVACSFYPSELSEMKEFLQFEKRVRHLGEKIFYRGDIMKLDKVLPQDIFFDAIVLSTVLYQMNARERARTVKQARNKLLPGGVLVVQDFTQKIGGGKKLEFNGSWFKDGFAYRTYVAADWTRWRWWEVLAWYNGRCKQVREGEDFDKFFGILNSK